VQLVSAPITLVIDAVSFVVSAVSLFAVRDLGMSAGTIGLVVSSGAVGALTAERSESQRPQSSEASSYPHRGGTR
jgi:hypothetical protein